MKYVDTKVVFSEIPDEITLAVNISGCIIRCPDCHSKYLWNDIGESLTRESLYNLIESNKGISCLALMGGDTNVPYLQTLFYWVKTRYPKLKTAWYSGRDRILLKRDVKYLDYVKTGPYIKERGPLNNKNTNQKLYKIHHLDENNVRIEDITYKFWNKQ